jgi:hypothetical protein
VRRVFNYSRVFHLFTDFVTDKLAVFNLDNMVNDKVVGIF